MSNRGFPRDPGIVSLLAFNHLCPLGAVPQLQHNKDPSLISTKRKVPRGLLLLGSGRHLSIPVKTPSHELNTLATVLGGGLPEDCTTPVHCSEACCHVVTHGSSLLLWATWGWPVALSLLPIPFCPMLSKSCTSGTGDHVTLGLHIPSLGWSLGLGSHLCSVLAEEGMKRDLRGPCCHTKQLSFAPTGEVLM